MEGNSTAKSPIRRARAGTLPSSFASANALNGLGSPSSLQPNTSRPTPSSSPFKSGSITPSRGLYGGNDQSAVKSALLSRLRAGSMPQRANLPGSAPSPFGPSIFSSNWNNGRERAGTLQSIQSSNDPSSTARSSISRDSLADTDVKTLDYLGLVDNPKGGRPTLGPSDIELLLEGQRVQNALQAPNAAGDKSANRFRSYSVNAKEKYEDEEDDLSQPDPYPGTYSGSLTPTSDANAAAHAVHEAVRQHNLEVQAFANFASASRPRARTAGVLDSPSTRLLRSYVPTPSKLDSTVHASDLRVNEEVDFDGLTEAVRSMQVNGSNRNEYSGEDGTMEEPTRALWLGNIPSSTTVSSLHVIFGNFGHIDSSRILTHKNCGFVNFEKLDSAVRAKMQLNNKEIFPGAGPIRIGFAKVPSAVATPMANTGVSSPNPDQFMRSDSGTVGQRSDKDGGHEEDMKVAIPEPPEIADIYEDIAQLVKELGASEEEQARTISLLDQAMHHSQYKSEIPPVPEPSANRTYDAPRLREIRKRIDNSTCSQAEMEEVALGMLPEISELSSDYLGNTVVQKLFEYCSENVKESMLKEIAPHIAEIGVHKNGTWAAQKIIDTAKSPSAMKVISENLRTYAVALFLDQFGNYVMQGCLRFQHPHNNFIFEVMLAKLWDLAQGRFGARAVRACLESHYATKDQQRSIAAAIALHSVQLATNANGALLLTWYLDTCTLPHRRRVLAPRLVPHLVQLCTHKVAYLTVLKLINQRSEPEACDTILKALFYSPNNKTLEQTLSDHTYGATLIFKILTTPFFDENIRSDVMQNIRDMLLKLKAQPAQGYKRLMDEVGLSTRPSGSANRDSSAGPRPGSAKFNGPNSMRSNAGYANQSNRQFYPNNMQPYPYNAHSPQQAMNFTGTPPKPGDPNAMDPYVAMNGINAPANAGMQNRMGSQQQQQQQQQPFPYSQSPGHQNAMIGRSAPFYPPVGMPAAYGSPGPPATGGPYQSGYPPSAIYGAPPMMGGMYGYPIPYAAPPPQQQQQFQTHQQQQNQAQGQSHQQEQQQKQGARASASEA